AGAEQGGEVVEGGGVHGVSLGRRRLWGKAETRLGGGFSRRRRCAILGDGGTGGSDGGTGGKISGPGARTPGCARNEGWAGPAAALHDPDMAHDSGRLHGTGRGD